MRNRMMIKRGLCVSLAGAVLVLAAAPLAAQSFSSLKNHDTNAPLDVDAERIEVRDREQIAVFSGNVKVVQGDLTLTADEIRVYYQRSGDSNPTIERLDATGDVRLVSPTDKARAQNGVYDVEERTITMTGAVELQRRADTLKGQRLQVNLTSGAATLDGAPPRGTEPAIRVTGRFTVPPKQSEPQSR